MLVQCGGNCFPMVLMLGGMGFALDFVLQFGTVLSTLIMPVCNKDSKEVLRMSGVPRELWNIDLFSAKGDRRLFGW